MSLPSLRHTLLALLLCAAVTPARAAGDEELSALGFIPEASESLVTTGRIPRPASQIAENVTVITADDIARLNAHTLAEVLQTVPGIQLDQVQTPGSSSFFSILSSYSWHIQVLIDGVSQNFISADNVAALGSIPAHIIERVEIIKGAASATWGSALGGVVNVVTKSPDPDRRLGGTVSASKGEYGTSDLHGDLSGIIGRFGYYLAAGNLYSHGMTPGTQVNADHAFGKFTYDLPKQGRLTLGLDYREKSNGLEVYAPWNYNDWGGDRYFTSYLNLNQPLADKLTLELQGQVNRRQQTTVWGEVTSPTLWADGLARETSRGGSMRLNWGDAQANLSAGLDYGHDDLHQREKVWDDPVNNFDRTLERFGASINGAWTVGRLTLLPGLRWDHTNLFDDAESVALGATWRLFDSTLLRAYGASGYSLPIVSNSFITNGSRELQRIKTIHTGFETTAIPYLWLKGTLFYNKLSKVQEFDYSQSPASVILKDQVRQGVELEAKTSPLYGFSLAAGYNYTDAYSKDPHTDLTGQQNAPQQGAKLALHYDNNTLGLKGALTGNYVWWRMPSSSQGSYSTTIWDLHLSKELFPGKERSPELFFSGRNLFNGSQYQHIIRPNTPRWLELGLRFTF